jgi:hypothetical protein
MLNGMVYVAGLIMGGGWRSLLPHQADLLDTLRMMLRYYFGVPFAKLTHREWRHPRFNTKYNALQRAAYFSVPVAASKGCEETGCSPWKLVDRRRGSLTLASADCKGLKGSGTESDRKSSSGES